MQNQNPPKINPSKLLSNSSFQGKGKNSGVYILKNDLVKIKKKVLKIEKLITNINFLKGKTSEISKKYKEQEKFKKREKDLEKKEESKEGGKIKLPEAPKLGFLDRIKNFITSILFGYIAIKLIDHLPKLIEVAKFIGSAFEFFADISGKLLNGLATFVQKGYEAYDFTRKTLKSFGGDQALKLFDGFNNAVGNVITAAIAASFALADMVGGDDGGGGSGGKAKRGFDNKGRRVGKDAQKRFAQRYGKSEFIRRFGKDNLKNLPKSMQRGALQKGARNAFVGLAGKGGAKAVLKFTKPFLNKLPIIGGLIDFGLSVALGEDPGRAAFKAIGAALLGSVGAAIGSVVPVAGTIIGGVAGGFLGDAAGGALYDYFFKNKKPKGKKQDVVKAAGGGQTPMTRAGKITGAPPKRTPKRIKSKRQIAIQPTPLKPGANVGGEYALENVFPRGEFEDETSPLDYIEQTYKKTGKDNFFGPILNLQTKSIVGQKPSKVDYRNAAQGLVNWMNITFSGEILRTGALHAAGGGQIDSELLANKSGDMVNVIANSIENLVSKRVTETVRDLMGQLDIDVIEGGGGSSSGTETTTESQVFSGGTGNYGVWGPLMELIASKESGGNYEAMAPMRTLPGATKMTIAEVARRATGAVGKYQQLPQYLVGRAKNAGLNPETDLYSPENQDMIAAKVNIGMNRGGNKWLEGKISTEEFMQRLSQEFAALPNANGAFYYSGQRSSITPDMVRNALSRVKSGGGGQPAQISGRTPTGVPAETGEMQSQQYKVEQASHPDTGPGWTVPGQTDANGRPIVFSKPAAIAFAKMIQDSGGVVSGKDIASSQRSLSKNTDIGGATGSKHLSGTGMDIHGPSQEWIKKNGAKYGWNWAPYGGPKDHGGHFEFGGSGGGTDTAVASSSTSTPSTPTRRKRTRRRSRRRRNRNRSSGTQSMIPNTSATSTNFQSGDGSFIQGNSGRSGGTHFHIGTTTPGDGSGVAAAGFNVIKHFLGNKSVFIGRSNEHVPDKASDEQIRGYIARGQAAHRKTELDVQVGGLGAGNKVAFPLALKGLKYSDTDGYGVSADIVGVNAFVGHGRYKPDGSLAPQQKLVLNSGAPDFYAFHGIGKLMDRDAVFKVHKGEYVRVVDKDSVDILGKDFISTINEIENKTELKQKVGSLIEHLKYIADYEPGAEQEVEVEIPEPEVVYMQTPVPIPMGGSVAGSSSGSSSNYTDMLYEHA